MILPVMLRHSSSNIKVLVYAILDTQFNTNFVTGETETMLNVFGCQTSLDLTTTSGRVNVPTLAFEGLEVRSVVNGSYIGISFCYVRDSIPCRQEIIPAADVVSKWPRLSPINIPQIYEDVPFGLLISYHCPQFMQPLEIVTGGDDEPFEWKTNLGWGVVGAFCADVNETDRFGTTHTVFTRLY